MNIECITVDGLTIQVLNYHKLNPIGVNLLDLNLEVERLDEESCSITTDYYNNFYEYEETL